MKRITFIFAILMSWACQCAQAQGLSQGQGIVNPSATPQKAEKHCEHCGIRMYNATNPWQHESWCPYYRSQSSSSGSRPSVSTSDIARMSVAGSLMAGIGDLLCGLITNKNSRPVDDTQYKNESYGGQTQAWNTFSPEFINTYVVLKDAKNGKVGIWRNARANPRSGEWETGFWVMEPIWDEIYVGTVSTTPGNRFNESFAIVRTSKKGKDGEREPLWDVYYLKSVYSDKVTPQLVSTFSASKVNFDIRTGYIAMAQKEKKTGEEKWGLYKWEVKETMKKGYPISEQSFVEKIAPQYAYLSTPMGPNNWTFAQREKGGNIGIIDVNNVECMPFAYTYAKLDPDAIAVQKAGSDKYGIIFNDKTTTDFIYDEVELPVGGYAYRIGDKWGFASYGNGGQTILPAEFEAVTREELDPELINDVYDGPALIVKKHNRWGVYEMDGTLVMPEVVPSRDKILYYLGASKDDSWRQASKMERRQLRRTIGEFETEEQFNARKNNKELEAQYEEKALAQFQKEFMVSRIKAAHDSRKGLTINWDKYDKQAEAFPFTSNLSVLPLYTLSMPMAEGAAFKEALTTMKMSDVWKTASFFVADDAVQIAEITFQTPGKTYHYVNPKLKDNRGAVIKYIDLF